MSRIVRVVGSGAIIRVEILLPRSGIFLGIDGVVVLKGGGWGSWRLSCVHWHLARVSFA